MIMGLSDGNDGINWFETVDVSIYSTRFSGYVE